MRRVLIILAVLILVAAGVLYLLGRGRIEDSLRSLRPPGAQANVPLMTVRLCFGDPSGSGLVQEDRIIPMGSSLNERLRFCLDEVARGPSLSTGAVPTIPSGTRLLQSYLDPEGQVYLDFNRALLGDRAPGDYEEWLAVASIVRAVCDNFPEVREVRFMISGQVVSSLDGYMDLEEPMTSEDFPLDSGTGLF